MKIVIIEDERLTATDLVETLQSLDNQINIVAVIKSVEEGKKYFSENEKPDLIFSDIRLGDGLSFEILASLEIPVVFCTAYDEYALNAFKANGIDYILKPFTENAVKQSLEKLKLIKGQDSEIWKKQYDTLDTLFKNTTSKSASLLIRHRDMIIPIRYEDIALFYLDKDIVKAYTFEKETYYPSKSLDELEKTSGENFYRANRQCLIHREAISHASNILSRKLSIHLKIPFKETILVSREKSSSFLRWLSGD